MLHSQVNVIPLTSDRWRKPNIAEAGRFSIPAVQPQVESQGHN